MSSVNYKAPGVGRRRQAKNAKASDIITEAAKRIKTVSIMFHTSPLTQERIRNNANFAHYLLYYTL